MPLNESRFINRGKQEQSPVDEDLSKSNPIVEAVLKPRWNVPLLSKYTSGVGKAAKDIDKYVEKKAGTSKVISLGALLGQYSLYGKMISPGDIMSTVTPGIGDVETGKYSLFDLALVGAEAIPVGKVTGKALKKSINKLLTPSVAGPHLHPKQFAKKVKKATKKGIQKDMAEGLEWQKEWINDPETFVRQIRNPLNPQQPITQIEYNLMNDVANKEFIRLARKPNMTRAKMKKAGFAEQWDAYKSYKDEMTARFDNIEFVDEVPLDYKNVEGEAIYTQMPNETTKEIVLKNVRKKLGHRSLLPPESASETVPRKVKMGLTPQRKGTLGYYRGEKMLDTFEDKLKYGEDKMGKYDEMIALSPDAYHHKILGPKSTSVHELQHYTTRGQDAIPSQVNSYINSLKPKLKESNPLIKEMVGKKGLTLKKEKEFWQIDAIIEKWKTNNTEIHGKRAREYSDIELIQNASYYGKNTEIQARLQQIRLALNLKPGQKVTKEMLEKIKTVKQASGPLHEVDLIIGRKNTIKALNALPALVPMMVEEELFNQWDKEDNIF